MKSLTNSKYLFCWLLVLFFLFSGCDLNYKQTVIKEKPINAPYQPFRVIQVCLDTPPLFPERYFREAANAIADRIDSSVNVNFGGMEVYVTLITHDSFQDDPLSFSIPAFGADPPKPLMVQGDGSYSDAENHSAYQVKLAVWQNQLIDYHLKLKQLRQWVTQQTKKLRTLPDPYDPVGADLYGCLQDASLHFQRVTADKYLLIASAMINNTSLQKTYKINLSGATVRVVWRTCQIAAYCQASDDYWRHVLLQFGAKSASFYDPAASEVEKPTF